MKKNRQYKQLTPALVAVCALFASASFVRAQVIHLEKTAIVAIGLGTRVTGRLLGMFHGHQVSTGRQLDVCIHGDGFFKIKVLPTQGDGLAYTRIGSFFENADGDLVLDSNKDYPLDPPIKIDPQATAITITTDGIVLESLPGNATPQSAGQIQLACFDNPHGLEQISGNLYQNTDASGREILSNPGIDEAGTLYQGTIESSKVDPIAELIEVIKTQYINSRSPQIVSNLQH
jgi:flagellar basal-body rod protein FlgG